MNKRTIIIGTRGSDLALWQANFVRNKLELLGFKVILNIIKTRGDKIQNLSFDKIEGKGFFTKELEDALLGGQINMAVHSMKDMPTVQPDGLVLGGVSYRENPQDWLLIRKDKFDHTQPLRFIKNGIIGTSSARRKALIRHLRPDSILVDIRGNVPTRIKKFENGDFNGIILAAAGLIRLNLDLSKFEVIKMDVREFIPAPAQGVLAYQTNFSDLEMRKILAGLHNEKTASCTNIERKVLKMMDGGCHIPLGVHVYLDQLGYFHAYGAFSKSINEPLKTFHLSSSTSINLAEQIYTGLTS